MPNGIIIFGGTGVGDTTLGKQLAEQLNWPHFDIDDYHWRWNTKIPYTIFRSAEDRTEHLMHDLIKHERFVMSGSMWSIRKAFEHFFSLAIFMTAPFEIRAERLQSRDLARWGDRVLPGGDMFEANGGHKDYFAVARLYDTDKSMQASSIMQHEQWINELPCPVLRVDGTKNVDVNVKLVMGNLSAYFCPQ